MHNDEQHNFPHEATPLRWIAVSTRCMQSACGRWELRQRHGLRNRAGAWAEHQDTNATFGPFPTLAAAALAASRVDVIVAWESSVGGQPRPTTDQGPGPLDDPTATPEDFLSSDSRRWDGLIAVKPGDVDLWEVWATVDESTGRRIYPDQAPGRQVRHDPLGAYPLSDLEAAMIDHARQWPCGHLPATPNTNDNTNDKDTQR